MCPQDTSLAKRHHARSAHHLPEPIPRRIAISDSPRTPGGGQTSFKKRLLSTYKRRFLFVEGVGFLACGRAFPRLLTIPRMVNSLPLSLPIAKRKTTLWVVSFWRREWDSNPRAREGKRFSRPPRYDHFDIPPGDMFSQRLIMISHFYGLVNIFYAVFSTIKTGFIFIMDFAFL